MKLNNVKWTEALNLKLKVDIFIKAMLLFFIEQKLL